MLEIVCCSTEGLLRTGNLDSRKARNARQRAICDSRMRMFSQGPRESSSKARAGTGAHNHGAAGNRPCGQCRLQQRTLVLLENSTQYFNFINFVICHLEATLLEALGSSDIDVLR